MAARFTGVACERTVLQVEANPESDSRRHERELIPELGVGLIARGGLRRQRLAPVSDKAENTGLVLGKLNGGVGDDFDVDMLQRARRAAVPVAHRLEVQ